MSLISRLFHKKGQQRGAYAPDRKPAFFDMEEEDPEEEENEVSEDTAPLSPADNQDSQETYEVLEREIHPAKIICPDCGGITLEGLEFCDKCGGELQ